MEIEKTERQKLAEELKSAEWDVNYHEAALRKSKRVLAAVQAEVSALPEEEVEA